MRVLVTIPAFYPALDYGGPVPVALNFGKRLVEKGHKVTVWTTNLLTNSEKLGDKTEVREVEGIHVVYFNSVARYRWVGITPDVFRYVHRELAGFDVIHIYGYREFLTLVVALWARRIGKPYILQALGTVPRIKRSQLKKFIYDVIAGRRILRGAAALLAKTPMDRKPYLDAGVPPEKVAVIQNGIDVPLELERIVKGGFRRRYGIGETEYLVLFLGRIDPNKGVGLLIEAFAKLKDGAKLAIVGPDEGHREEFERLAADRGLGESVLFTGPLYGDQKWSAYLDADIYVLPSVRENFGMTVLEALSCGTPVVLTEGCGIAPQVVDRAGLVVPYDERALAAAIEHLRDNPELGDRLVEGGRRLLLEEFSWDRPVADLEQLYKQVVSGRARETGFQS